MAHVSSTIGNGRWTAVAALVIATSVSACAPLPWRTLSSSHEDAIAVERHDVAPPSTTGFAPANATPAQRRDTLDRIWRTVDDEYYDADVVRHELPALVAKSTSELETVASDADFYRVLQRNVGAMPDSHTLVRTPLEAERSRTRQAVTIGIEYGIVEGRVVITEVASGFSADEQGVRRGMIIESIDDQPIDDAFLAAAREDASDEASPESRQLHAVWSRLHRAEETPRPHRVTLLRADDSKMQVELLARAGDVPTIERFDLLSSGVGVLRLSHFDPSVLPRIADDLDRAATESRALVIDLRHNPGGAFDAFTGLLDHFIDRPVALSRVTFRLWKFPLAFTIDGEGVAKPYRKPIAVLTDGATGSAAELAAHALAELRGAIVVGTPTCGCVVGILREFVLPDGGVLHVAEVGISSPHGRRMEADPLEPTLLVAPTLAQIRSGADVALQVAERALLAVEPADGQAR